MNDDSRARCPFFHASADAPAAGPTADRRQILKSLGLAGLGLAGGTGAAAAQDARQVGDAASAAGGRTIDSDGTQDRQPFFGKRQAGVTTPEPAATLVVAFDVLADGKADLQRLFVELTRRIAFLTKGGVVPVADELLPPPDSGLLGPSVFPDNLTVTVAVGASLFDERYGLEAEKPRHLVRMTQFPNDALEAEQCHGDLLLQICSNTAETNIHALRDVLKHFPDLLALRWKLEGFLPPHTVKKLGKDTVRNLLGFKDGTANLNASDQGLMDRHVWIGAGHDEPAWTKDGSYQVVRLIRMTVERWDRTPLHEQETIMGRQKASGAPLGMAAEHDIPDYASDPKGERIPLDAHIRLANPRTPETDKSLILRRPYNYSHGMTKAGQLDMGLLFVAFQANLTEGFVAVQNRLNGEPLEEYIKPFGGGYFFVLPGAESEEHYIGQPLIRATA